MIFGKPSPSSQDGEVDEDSPSTLPEPIRPKVLTFGPPARSSGSPPSEDSTAPTPSKPLRVAKLKAADTVSLEEPPVVPSNSTATCPYMERYAIEVLVVGAHDEPIAELAVELRKSDTEALASKTDASGRARFEALQKQRYDLCLPTLDSATWEVVGREPLPAERARSAGNATWRAPAKAPEASSPHVVVQGECLAEIAARHGFLSEVLWNLPDNGKLKELRGASALLFPGDEVVLPALRVKTQSCEVGEAFRLRRKGAREQFRVRFLSGDGTPRGGIPYLLTLELEGGAEERKGETDGDGYVSEPVPPDVDKVRLVLGKEEPQEVYEFQMAYLDPLDTISGVQARLTNLGYPCGEVSGELDSLTRRALRDFQRDHSLEVTGELDDTTRKKLEELYLS
ncbi:hypothetical protein F0U61_53780 [Archangium violaceum]|nr:hypothetical protein F0U61_53780 [Archangium violaceum]